MTDLVRNHPELREGEVLFSNVTRDNTSIIIWKTARFGETAYDIYNQVVSTCIPVFVQREEIIAAGHDPEGFAEIMDRIRLNRGTRRML